MKLDPFTITPAVLLSDRARARMPEGATLLYEFGATPEAGSFIIAAPSGAPVSEALASVSVLTFDELPASLSVLGVVRQVAYVP